jgi:RNA polymerase sigma-70 factor (ECF subfamily)
MSAFDLQSSDGLLIAAALAGEREAFAHLVRRYQGPLLRAAISRLGRRVWAEEAVQETFLCAHRWLATYDSRYSFRTWLWTILLNQCSRVAKREAKHVALVPALSQSEREHDRQPSPLDLLLAKEASDQLYDLLAKLPEVQADALRLRFFGGLTFPEIAAAMKCSEPGAKIRVKTGLVTLATGWAGKMPAPRDAERTATTGRGRAVGSRSPARDPASDRRSPVGRGDLRSEQTAGSGDPRRTE